jgi:signal transduction histidine kinase/ActR/RegA family two-component response regulator
MARRSIRKRLVASGFAATAVALILAFGASLWQQREGARRTLLERLDATAAIVGANCTAALVFRDRAAAREALESVRHVPGTVEAVLYDAGGAPFAEYRVAGERAHAPVRAGPAARLLGARAAEVVAPVQLGADVVGHVYVRASTETVDREAFRAAAAAAAVTAAALLVAFALLSRLVARATRPIVELSALTEEVARRRDYALRARPSGADELATLAEGFNAMLVAIQDRDAALVAHRATLEAEVVARTADLARTNARLGVELAERQRAEEALSAAARSWSATFDAIRDGLCVLDVHGRVLRTNRAMDELVGAEPGASVGEPIQVTLARLLPNPEGADLAAGEGRALRCGGRRWFELQRDRLELPGGTRGFVQLVAEVTRQHDLQAQLAQSSKMEAVGLLAGGVAHDFNNLLTVILSCASSLAEELRGGELAPLADEVERAARSAAALTRQLLAFSRKQVLHPEVLEARQVVAGVARMIERLIGEHIRFVLDVEGTKGHVRLDPSQLEQVLVNLAVNARDAMAPRGGTLTVQADDVAADETGPRARGRLRPGTHVRIRVTDTGCGMDVPTQERIFEPFFTTKDKGRGTGLGLAMVYAAVQQAGGAIEVTSAPGAGSTFTLYYPTVEAQPAPAAEPAPAAARQGSGERILVVEDEPQVRATLARFLGSAGYQVTEAGSGLEGLEVFRDAQGAFDLVLTDLVMPGLGGIELGRTIHERSTIPVLYMSGYSEDIASGKERIPAEWFVPKPFDRVTVLARVGAALDHHAGGRGPR